MQDAFWQTISELSGDGSPAALFPDRRNLQKIENWLILSVSERLWEFSQTLGFYELHENWQLRETQTHIHWGKPGPPMTLCISSDSNQLSNKHMCPTFSKGSLVVTRQLTLLWQHRQRNELRKLVYVGLCYPWDREKQPRGRYVKVGTWMRMLAAPKIFWFSWWESIGAEQGEVGKQNTSILWKTGFIHSSVSKTMGLFVCLFVHKLCKALVPPWNLQKELQRPEHPSFSC